MCLRSYIAYAGVQMLMCLRSYIAYTGLHLWLIFQVKNDNKRCLRPYIAYTGLQSSIHVQMLASLASHVLQRCLELTDVSARLKRSQSMYVWKA